MLYLSHCIYSLILYVDLCRPLCFLHSFVRLRMLCCLLCYVVWHSSPARSQNLKRIQQDYSQPEQRREGFDQRTSLPWSPLCNKRQGLTERAHPLSQLRSEQDLSHILIEACASPLSTSKYGRWRRAMGSLGKSISATISRSPSSQVSFSWELEKWPSCIAISLRKLYAS